MVSVFQRGKHISVEDTCLLEGTGPAQWHPVLESLIWGRFAVSLLVEPGRVADDHRKQRRNALWCQEVGGQPRVALQEHKWSSLIRTHQDQLGKGGPSFERLRQVPVGTVADTEGLDALLDPLGCIPG